MALITRRQFVQQTAISAGAHYSFPFQPGKGKASVDPAAIRKLASQVGGRVITPDATDYESIRRVNNHAYDRHPAVIVRCARCTDVARALDFGRGQN